MGFENMCFTTVKPYFLTIRDSKIQAKKGPWGNLVLPWSCVGAVVGCMEVVLELSWAPLGLLGEGAGRLEGGNDSEDLKMYSTLHEGTEVTRER